jgi:hypothetical protein
VQGDFVYVRRHNITNTLQMSVRPEILRVAEVRPMNMLLLQGKCGQTITFKAEHCTPCHLPDIDPTIDATLARPGRGLSCVKCSLPDREEVMLLCDYCGAAWHTTCLTPPLTSVPEGTWLCASCLESGVDPILLGDATDRVVPLVQKGFTAKHKAASKAAAKLAGQWVSKKCKEHGSDKWVMMAAQLEFRGADAHPHYLLARFVDGHEELLQLGEAQKLLAVRQRPCRVSRALKVASVCTAAALPEQDASDKLHAARSCGVTAFSSLMRRVAVERVGDVWLCEHPTWCLPNAAHAHDIPVMVASVGRFLHILQGSGEPCAAGGVVPSAHVAAWVSQAAACRLPVVFLCVPLLAVTRPTAALAEVYAALDGRVTYVRVTRGGQAALPYAWVVVFASKWHQQYFTRPLC